MKKLALAGLLVASIAIIFAVSLSDDLSLESISSEPAISPEPTESEPATSSIPSEIQIKADPSSELYLPPDITTANNQFAIDFYNQVSDNNENIFFSPPGIFIAFSILYEGAQHTTADQIQRAFGFEPNEETRHNSTANFMSIINKEDPHATLEMSNALWVADWFEIYDSYTDIARGVYLADTEQVDFTGDGTDKINAWAANKTNDKIKKVITKDTVSEFTAAVITNAIYFLGTWVQEFDPKDTKQQEFWKNNDENVMADFMNMQETEINYTSFDGASSIRLPYNGDRLSMLIILPDDIDGISDLEERLTPDLISKLNQDMYPTEINLEMPKFKIKTTYDLKPPLQNLGMIDVFEEEAADLHKIGDAGGLNLYVSSASQDAFVKIDEKGTEAAAVTVIVIVAESYRPTQEFIADHPFIFIIQDDASGTILFMGRISDPS